MKTYQVTGDNIGAMTIKARDAKSAIRKAEKSCGYGITRARAQEIENESDSRDETSLLHLKGALRRP